MIYNEAVEKGYKVCLASGVTNEYINGSKNKDISKGMYVDNGKINYIEDVVIGKYTQVVILVVKHVTLEDLPEDVGVRIILN